MRSDNSSPEQELRAWIKSVYFQKETLQQLRDSFHQQKRLIHLQLYDFLQHPVAATLLQHMKKSTLRKEYIPDRHSFCRVTPDVALQPFLSFLRSSVFFHYIKNLTGLPLTKKPAVELFRFASGNYTLLHDALQQPSGLYLQFEFTLQWDASWGGYEVYSAAEEDPLVFQPRFNSLTLVRLNKEIQQFTKYINYLAGKQQRFFLRVFYPL